MKRESHEDVLPWSASSWADATHDVQQATGTERREFLILDHRPEASDAWATLPHALQRTTRRGVPGAE